MINDSMAIFTNVIDINASGLSGNTSYDFATLSVEENELTELSVYPNPATGIINIISADVILVKAEIFTMNGQLLLSKNNNLETIQINQLQSGIYFIKLYTESTNRTIKVIKE